jgi:hypothetical protein
MNLIKSILANPFEYAFGAVTVLMAVGFVVRFAKEVWDDLWDD